MCGGGRLALREGQGVEEMTVVGLGLWTAALCSGPRETRCVCSVVRDPRGGNVIGDMRGIISEL